MEKNTDAFLESNEKSKKKQEEVEETVNNRKLKRQFRMDSLALRINYPSYFPFVYIDSLSGKKKFCVIIIHTL